MKIKDITQTENIYSVLNDLEANDVDFTVEERILNDIEEKLNKHDDGAVILNDIQDLIPMVGKHFFCKGIKVGMRLYEALKRPFPTEEDL